MAAQEQFLPPTTVAPGAHAFEKRIADLDSEGIWSESVFPSLGMWSSSFHTLELLCEAMRASNDWSEKRSWTTNRG
ncbi:hypothetical protein [Mycobacterium lepromatosis]|uniref:Uncharacterized protein n=2 Tax=Mycobacterium lepromatosis TaxID=480418 RepID=A0A0F4ER01_9MYCO|nr:hypothetical protein [Mycobacterium lepromatosis]KJX75401.1 hypothetical protein MLPM_0947 [Mycobacterium lepromatosis]